MTTTATDAVGTVLANVEAASNATVIRNAPTFGHVIRPRRTRAAFIVTAHHRDPVDACRFNGQGHIVETLSGTVDEVTAFILGGL